MSSYPSDSVPVSMNAIETYAVEVHPATAPSLMIAPVEPRVERAIG
jgi:hypothetical protein